MSDTTATHSDLRPRGRLDFYQDDYRTEVRGDPRRRIRTVAIVLVVFNVLSLLAVMGILVQVILYWSEMIPENRITGIVFVGLLTPLHAVTLWGLVSALRLRSYLWAWIGVGLSVVPCANLVALFWLPLLASAWGLLILLDPEVRKAFRK